MNDERKDLHHDHTPTGHLDEAAPESRRTEDRGPATPGAARAAGLEPEGATTGARDREISGELDRAVDAPDHDVTRKRAENSQEETPLPIRGR